MLVILVLVIRVVNASQTTVCATAPFAFRRGEPSQAQTLILLSDYTVSVPWVEHF